MFFPSCLAVLIQNMETKLDFFLRTVISTKADPGAIGPYSQAFKINGIIYTSGQIPVNPENGKVPEGIEVQTEQSCKNVGEILKAAGSGFEGVFKTNCFLADMNDFAAFNQVYSRYFVPKQQSP